MAAQGAALASRTVFDNAVFAFNNSDSLVCYGSISGSGSLLKNGSGVVALSGSNTYNGATTVSGGTLLIGNGGAGAALASPTVVDNAVFGFDNFDTIAYPGSISGSGGLAKLGWGTLILSGANSYQRRDDN